MLHALHALAPTTAYLPLAQSLHAPELYQAEYLPGAHGVHSVIHASLKEPGVQAGVGAGVGYGVG
jgi:hypothetical protein